MSFPSCTVGTNDWIVNAFDCQEQGHRLQRRLISRGFCSQRSLRSLWPAKEKEQILDALKDGQSWLDSNPEADAEEIKEKHKEVEGICVSW